jgi:hypothetical protein
VEGIDSEAGGILELACADSEAPYRYHFRLERSAIEGTRTFDNSKLERVGVERAFELNKKSEGDETHFYALQEGRFFVPLTDPHCFAGTVHVDELLKIAPSGDLLYFGLWESIALQMMSDAHCASSGKLNRDVWQTRWAGLAGGAILVKAVTGYLENGDLSRTERLRTIALLESGGDGGPELAENLLLRLCGAWSRKRISPEAFLTTLVCKHFRRSITHREIQQMKHARSSYFASSYGGDDVDMKTLNIALAAIESPTVDPPTTGEFAALRDAIPIRSPMVILEAVP